MERTVLRGFISNTQIFKTIPKFIFLFLSLHILILCRKLHKTTRQRRTAGGEELGLRERRWWSWSSLWKNRHALSSELPSTPFLPGLLSSPPNQIVHSFSEIFRAIISITATLLSIYPDVNMTEKLKEYSRTLYITPLYLLTLLLNVGFRVFQ